MGFNLLEKSFVSYIFVMIHVFFLCSIQTIIPTVFMCFLTGYQGSQLW